MPFTFLQIWTATSIVLLPIVFLALFYLGWRLMPEKPYTMGLIVETRPERSFLASIGEKLIVFWVVAIFLLFLAGVILVSIVIHWDQRTLTIWSLVLTFGLTLAALFGFVCGSLYMEDYRKGVLLVSGALLLALGFIFFGVPSLTDSLEFTPRYFAGVLAGVVASLVTWHYLARRWDPALMATVYESRTDAFFTYSQVGQTIFWLTLIGIFAALPLLGVEDVAITCVGIWVFLTFGYMMIRVFWNRPRRFDI